jgi:hypothetical protein
MDVRGEIAMNQWLRKISAILITVMTLGLYAPPIHLDAESVNSKEVAPETDSSNLQNSDVIRDEEILPIDENELSDQLESNVFIQELTEKAKEQTVAKLGPKIVNQVQDDIVMSILPTIETALQTILKEAEDEVEYYAISELPSSGYGEKIFHIIDERTKKDVAKFHVRRDNRPTEGYWFNFHYHLDKDNFEEHHYLGEVYYDKNTPPKWMS